MHTLSAFISLTFISFTLAQSNNPTLQVQAIEAHFQHAHIVPDLLASFEPRALLTADYAGVGKITPGQLLTRQQSATTPIVTVTPANSSVQLTGAYTIMMVDADVVGSNLSNGVNHHWLVNSVVITDNKVSNASATTIVAYAGPGPAAGSGPHRYVVILYEQPPNFTPPANLSHPTGVSLFDLNAYVKDSGLGPLIAATYLRVEEGTVTASIPVTSSVVTSSLPAAISTRTSTATGTSTGGAAAKTNAAVNLQGFSPAIVFAGIAILMAS